MTAVYNTALTAAQWNTHVRDNSLLTMPALATAGSRWFISRNDSTKLQEETITSAQVATSETTTSTSYTALTTAGPAITCTTRTKALVFFGAKLENTTVDVSAFVSVAVSGATTIAASDEWCLTLDGAAAANANRWGMAKLFDNLTAGSNTFTLQYKVAANTGTFADRDIAVVAM
jgi:hypothetical protein